MKKITTLICALFLGIMLLSAFGCAKMEDSQKIEKNGYFTCGITYYEPMNYLDDKGTLIGFDTELAQAVAKYLNLEVKFQKINWDAKFVELNSGNIDCIWNGFTVDEERASKVTYSYDYLKNSQCVVIKKSDINTLNTKESLKGKKGMAETGSAGEANAKEFAGESNYTPAAAQTSALFEVKSSTADFAVIDLTMADAMVGKGDYSDLMVVEAIVCNAEVYGIGFRKNSDFVGKVNEALVALNKDGTILSIAEKYGLADKTIENLGK